MLITCIQNKWCLIKQQVLIFSKMVKRVIVSIWKKCATNLLIKLLIMTLEKETIHNFITHHALLKIISCWKWSKDILMNPQWNYNTWINLMRICQTSHKIIINLKMRDNSIFWLIATNMVNSFKTNMYSQINLGYQVSTDLEDLEKRSIAILHAHVTWKWDRAKAVQEAH